MKNLLFFFINILINKNMEQFLNKLRDFLKKALSKIHKAKHSNGWQNNHLLSLKEIEKAELAFKPVPPEKVKREYLIQASQLPIHILPHIDLLRRGVYQIQFSPAIQSQIKMGALNVTGGVVRNPQGQIVEHGTNINPAVLTPAILLYHIGVITFGVHQLAKINESLQKMNKKLDTIFSFLQDQRSFEIKGSILELSHLFKGILEFKKSGNTIEILNRIDMIKNIRKSNISNFLHLQKNLQDRLEHLNTLKRTSWFRSKKETIDLLDSIESFEIVFTDYSRSLLLDIYCTEVEVSFSVCHSAEEVKSRLSVLKNQTNFLEQCSNKFENLLNTKISQLIKDLWSNDEIIQLRSKRLKAYWNQIKKNIYELNKKYRNHIQSIESIINSKERVFFLQKQDPSECKKIA